MYKGEMPSVYISPFLTDEMSSSSEDTALSDAAKYFKMKKQAVIANHLMEYVSTT